MIPSSLAKCSIWGVLGKARGSSSESSRAVYRCSALWEYCSTIARLPRRFGAIRVFERRDVNSRRHFHFGRRGIMYTI